MSLKRYGAEGSNLTIFGIPIEEFGDTDPPITISDIEQRATLKRGIGGTSLRMDNKTAPLQLEVNLMPDSIEVRQLLAAAKTGADVTFEFYQTGTNEKVIGFDGVLINRGNIGRGGKTNVSDEQLVFEFSDSEET